ncbi:Lipoprotein-releasing system ATP-binding protein LolD [compost metagenome]
MTMEILRIEHLSKIYGTGESAVKALDEVSFSVQKGEFIAIIGPSGSGKSTLLHMLGGVDRPSGGKVLVEDTDMYALNETQLAIFRRRQIGLIYQFFNLIPVLTVEENMTLPLLLDKQKVDQKQLNSLVHTLHLQHRLNHLPNQLSGGQQQRVSIGRALIGNPAIILADEPTGNLDSKNSSEIVDLLKMLNKTYHQTLIVITHDERIALQADRIISIEDGRIAKDEVIRR